MTDYEAAESSRVELPIVDSFLQILVGVVCK